METTPHSLFLDDSSLCQTVSKTKQQQQQKPNQHTCASCLSTSRHSYSVLGIKSCLGYLISCSQCVSGDNAKTVTCASDLLWHQVSMRDDDLGKLLNRLTCRLMLNCSIAENIEV